MYERREYNDNLKTLSQHTIAYSVIQREEKMKKNVVRSIIMLAMLYIFAGKTEEKCGQVNYNRKCGIGNIFLLGYEY